MISCQIFKKKKETCIIGITSFCFSAHMSKSSPQGEGVRKCGLWERLHNRIGALVNKPFPKRPGRALSWRLLGKQLLLRTPALSTQQVWRCFDPGFSVSRGGGNRFLWPISCWVYMSCSISREMELLRHWDERLQPWLRMSCPAVSLPASLAPFPLASPHYPIPQLTKINTWIFTILPLMWSGVVWGMDLPEWFQLPFSEPFLLLDRFRGEDWCDLRD